MAVFAYRAFTASGDLAEGRIEADNAANAEDLLAGSGLTAFETSQAHDNSATEAWWKREIWGEGRIRLADLVSFTRELAFLAQAGIPLDDCLRLQAGQASNSRMRAIADFILTELINGALLSDALSRRPKVFSAIYVNMARAGEADGALDRALAEIAALLEGRLELQSKLSAALIYPAVLVAMSLASVAIVIGVLVPNIAPILSQDGAKAPGGLLFLIAVHRDWRLISLVLASILGAGFIALRLALARPAQRLVLDGWIIARRPIGPLVAKLECARFARTLGALTRARVPFLQAMKSAASVVSNRRFAAELDIAAEAVREGETLSSALARIAYLPRLAPRLVAIGEESGQLDATLIRLADLLSQQAKRQIDRIMTLLTPALTILISLAIGGMIYSVMNAILALDEMALR